MVRQHLGDEVVLEGMKLDDQICIVVLVANYMLVHIITSILHISITVTGITCFLHVNACNYLLVRCHYMHVIVCNYKIL